MIKEFVANLDYVFLYVFFCNTIKVNHFLHRFITLLYLLSSISLTRFLLLPYAYLSIESIYFIFLSSFEVKAILIVSSVKILCLSLLIFCCVFNVILLYFMNPLRPFTSILFFLNGSFHFQFELLLSSLYNLEI